LKARRLIALLLVLTTGTGTPGWGSFFSHGSMAISASATVGAGIGFLVTPLPSQAFFGKNVVIPVTITNPSGPISTQNLAVSMVYQLVDISGAALGPPVSVPVTFGPAATASISARATVSTSLTGTAVIQISDLAPIQHGGGIQYVFQAQQGTARTLLSQAGVSRTSGSPNLLASPFQTMITDTVCQSIDAQGGHLDAPDLFEKDGKTSVTLPPGAVSSAGNLCIKQENIDGWPTGPGGSQPAAIYTVTFNGAALTQPAQISLSYSTDASGTVADLHVSAEDLSIYWLGPENLPSSSQSWRVLSRASVDPTLHTVSGFTSHFSTFGLFSAGQANTASAIRPAERIITPNGDGINDTASFPGLIQGQDDVRIFDVRGRRVRHMTTPAPGCGGSFCWDGKDDSGSVVESGVYIYQYTSQGERVSGVIGVAK